MVRLRALVRLGPLSANWQSSPMDARTQGPQAGFWISHFWSGLSNAGRVGGNLGLTTFLRLQVSSASAG